MTLAQLRYFCTAARFHSVTQAARTLHVTQPTISIAIRDLEREFSITLFQHSGTQISLTQEGEIFYQKASQILSTCEDLRGEYSGKSGFRHHVRLGIPPLLSTVFFPEMLDSFHVDYPDTWLELHEFGSARASALVRDDVLDIGLVNMEMPDIDKFQSMQLKNDPLCFCVSSEHPMAYRTSLTLRDLDFEPIILFGRDSVHNQLLQARFDSLKISPRIVMHSNQITTILSFLRQGKCGCFFYKSMLPLFPELTGIDLDPPIDTRIGLIWKRGRYLSRGMQEFLAFCRTYYIDKKQERRSVPEL